MAKKLDKNRIMERLQNLPDERVTRRHVDPCWICQKMFKPGNVIKRLYVTGKAYNTHTACLPAPKPVPVAVPANAKTAIVHKLQEAIAPPSTLTNWMRDTGEQITDLKNRLDAIERKLDAILKLWA